MELKEGYRMTEVGVIPEDWEVRSMGELTTLMTNGFVGPVKNHYTESDDGVLYIQGYNVEENAFNFFGIKKVTRDFHLVHLKSKLCANDLLTIQTGDVGVTTIVPKELEGSNCHALIISRFQNNWYYSRFFSYYLNSDKGRKRLKEIETGTTMKHINVGDFIPFKVPVPPLKEQTAIANALSDVDALISSLEKLIEKKKRIKEGAMQQLLQPKEGWVEKRLGDVASIDTDNLTSGTNPEYKFNYISLEDVTEGQLTHYSTHVFAKAPSRARRRVKQNDVLISTVRPNLGSHLIFSLTEEHFICSTGFSVVRCLEGVAESRFIFFCFFHIAVERQIQSLIAGSSYPAISSRDVKNIVIYMPTYQEQVEISRVLDEMQLEIWFLQKKVVKLNQIKQGMMQNLLTGKIRLVKQEEKEMEMA